MSHVLDGLLEVDEVPGHHMEENCCENVVVLDFSHGDYTLIKISCFSHCITKRSIIGES